MNDPLADELRACLGEVGVLTAPEDRVRFEEGWRYGRGTARCVARPTNAEEVAEVLRICARFDARVIAQGANTGLVAASTPDESGSMVVLSLERLNRTIEIDVHNRTVRVDGGVLLSQLNQALAPHGLWFPIDLGADPQIGGMIATNTGGTRLIRYGDVAHNLLGLEVVLGDGRIASMLQGLRKNNTGLDAKQLFVGTTGVWGIVTQAVLEVAPIPTQRATALVACTDGEAVLTLLTALEAKLSDLLSAFEVMSAAAMDAVFRHQHDLRKPFQELPSYAVLVELSTTLPTGVLPLAAVLEEALGTHLETAGPSVLDVLIGHAEDFWKIRHHISESLRNDGKLLALDLSVPRSALPAFSRRVAAVLAESYPFIRLCDYGHWGDGGSHLNLLWPESEDHPDLKATLQDQIYEIAVREFHGSFSAEHGVGPHNQRHYDRYTDPITHALSQTLDAFLDPENRLGTVRLGSRP